MTRLDGSTETFRRISFDTEWIRVGKKILAIHPIYLLSLMTLIRHEAGDNLITNRSRVAELKQAARFLCAPAVEVSGMPRARVQENTSKKVPSFSKLIRMCNAYVNGRQKEFEKLREKAGLAFRKNVVDILLGWVYLMTCCYIARKASDRHNYINVFDLGLSGNMWKTIRERFLDKVRKDLPLEVQLSQFSDLIYRTVSNHKFLMTAKPGFDSVLNHLNFGAQMCEHAADDYFARLQQRGCATVESFPDDFKRQIDNVCMFDLGGNQSSGPCEPEKMFGQADRPAFELLMEEERLAQAAHKQFGMNAEEASEYTVDELFASPFIDCREISEDCINTGIFEVECRDGHLRFFVDREVLKDYLRQSLNARYKTEFDNFLRRHIPDETFRKCRCGNLCAAPIAGDLFVRDHYF